MENPQKLTDILNAPPEHLRAVLRIFCTKNNEARDTITDYLSVLKSQASNNPADLEFCEKCEKPYFEADNKEGACCFHTGNCYVDEDASVWGDWVVEELGYMDAPGNIEEYPEGFVWDCCNSQANGPGCKSGKHIPMHCSYNLRHSSILETLQTGGPAKREREEFAESKICERCDQAFTDHNNHNEACTYHTFPLELNVDGLVWTEHDAPAPEDTPYYRMRYPGGFIYECCESDGSMTGCTRGPHKAKGDKKVKGDTHETENAKARASIAFLCS
ncbi:hypothetical protein QBC40DRAFT_332135 [Triangularia verruculosa]|uniref:Uncharacterized protein n=1 Tax=Triangularia verruculosa TaxID=2587418 RepID=A0AAN6XC64_9PEZI|nr:hypothetical protein QBC40DRAFT_332135 [Triangularia verruculosa]